MISQKTIASFLMLVTMAKLVIEPASYVELVLRQCDTRVYVYLRTRELFLH